jgi:hypothetical protein
MRFVALLFASAVALLAQPDPRELVRESIRNGEQAWRRSFDYRCVKRDVTRQLDSTGHVRGTTEDLYDEIPVGEHASFEELVQHDNEPVPRVQLAREERELERLRAENPTEKQRLLGRQAADRSYMLEVPDAFDFKMVGVQNLPTGPAWVLDATPHPGYIPKSRYAHLFHAMHGRLWIDQQARQWVKADAVSMSEVTFGFVARLSKGSHITIEQMKLPDGSWVPNKIRARASARLFLFLNRNFEEEISYSSYRKGEAAAMTVTASRPMAGGQTARLPGRP